MSGAQPRWRYAAPEDDGGLYHDLGGRHGTRNDNAGGSGGGDRCDDLHHVVKSPVMSTTMGS